MDKSTQNPISHLAPLELKFADGNSGIIEGYASVFGPPADRQGDIIARGAYKRTLAEHQKNGTKPVMLWAHDPKRPIGKWLSLQEDSFGLAVSGKLNLETSDGRNAYQHIAAGDIAGLSIGYLSAHNGTKVRKDGLRELTLIDLYEISVVAIPSEQRARIVSVKQLETKSDLVSLLRDGGLSKAAAVRIAAGGWPALNSAEDIEPQIADLLRDSVSRFKGD